MQTGLCEFANFSDTATRFEFWWFLLFVVLVTAVSPLFNSPKLLPGYPEKARRCSRFCKTFTSCETKGFCLYCLNSE